MTDAIPPTATADAGAAQPQPRTVGPAASRRAWTYPTVRFWWILAVVFAAAAVVFAVQNYLRWTHDAELVRSGAVVQARFWEAGASYRIDNRPIPPDRPIQVEYEYDGKPYSHAQTFLPDQSVRYLSGKPVDVRVDPANPMVWTNRTEPPSLLKDLLGPLLLLPPILVALAVAWILRRRILDLYRAGQVRQAVVVDARQSALAPLSQALRVTLPDAADRRLISVFVPHAQPRLRKGDTLAVLAHPTRPTRAVPADAFA